MDKIKWKYIEGYEGLYEVSYCGKVRRHKNNSTNIIKQSGSRLYFVVVLSKSGVCKGYYVHRLVAKTFHPNPENKPEVNHIDGDKRNNHGDNLEWVTRSEQIKHAYRIGLAKGPPGRFKDKFGKDHKDSKPVDQYDLSGRLVAEYDSAMDAVRTGGFNQSCISLAALGKMSTHRGFIWKYNAERRAKNLRSLINEQSLNNK